MIVWSGRGFLAVLVLIASLFACMAILPDDWSDYAFVISFFVAGIFSGVFGKKWNTQNKRTVIDEQTGQRLTLKNNHSLFWIPMQYWGIIFSLIATSILFQNSIVYGAIAATILLAIIIVPFVIPKSKEQNNTDPVQKMRAVPEVKKTSSSNEIVAELKKEKVVKSNFTESDHSKFMPK